MLNSGALVLLCLVVAAAWANGDVYVHDGESKSTGDGNGGGNVQDGGLNVEHVGRLLTDAPTRTSCETLNSLMGCVSPGPPAPHSDAHLQGCQGCEGDNSRVEAPKESEETQTLVLVMKDSENKTKYDKEVFTENTTGSGEKGRLLDKLFIRCKRTGGKCSLRRRREAEEKRTVSEEDNEGGDMAEGGEELPDPEALAWIDPGRLASQGVAMEHVPSLANLMGLRMVRYKTPQPRPLHPPYRPQPHPLHPPNRNPQLPASSTSNIKVGPSPKPASRLNSGNDLFGNSFHDSFDRYFKSFNRYEGQDIRRSNSHTRPPVEGSSYSYPPPRGSSPSPPAPSPPRFQNGASRAQPPQPQPIDSFSRPAYSGLGNTADSIMKLLNPFNILGPNQFPQLPRFPYPVPPPNYDPRRPQSFQRLRPTDPLGTEEKEFPQENIKYEVVMDPNQDAYRGYQYKNDFPLRDDLYVGQDGNIYLKSVENASPQNPFGRQHFGGHGRPAHSFPPPHNPSHSTSPRPHHTRPISPQEGRFEDEELDNIDQDYDDDYEEVSSYSSLLQNHNMNDIDLDPPTTPINNHNPHQFRNSPSPRPYRDHNNFDQRIPHNGRNPGIPNNPYVIRTPPNLFPNSGLLSWLFPSYARTTYPNFFYNPREVQLPRFRYPVGPWPRQTISPSVGTPSDANYPGAPNPPTHPRSLPPSSLPSRPLPLPSSPSRPSFRNPSPPRPPTSPLSPMQSLLPNPSPRPQRPPLLPPRPSLYNPSPLRPSLHPSLGQPSNPQLNNAAQGINNRPRVIFEGGRVKSSGFYPGNGFFDSDFPTVFHMAPSQQNRVVEQLPRPMGQNATAPTNETST
ncbi:adhesive plaque matrix protein-like [Homarus americanus]|uniref:Putative Serine/arginine repetitive matrix protein 1-like 4 n=1 Tax=Homarus americanus TaxID=6706 RepID=A0A8J5N4J1_HOMAM|nr:adhesive plaque matrix protein-like [Homarus americanus]KAG7173272.1 putative Serine/arginine repetitive matrix protein 1-like 4 [Homarus americanus]